MKLGVSVGYWGFGLTAADQLDIARTAEDLGYDSIWTAEAYGSDAATVLAWLAAGTSRIKLGAGIFQIPARSAAMTAMTAATIDQLSGGRFLLGLGTSGPQVSEGWHGVRFAKQLQRTREYVAVVRMALAHQKVEFHGETHRAAAAGRPGQGAQAHDQAGSGAASRSTWRCSARRTSRSRARSPTAGCPSSSRPSTPRRCACRSRRAPRAPAARSTISGSVRAST